MLVKGARVKVWTCSGSYRGAAGVITAPAKLGAFVALDEDPKDALFFSIAEIVPLDEPTFTGAE